MCVSDFSIKVYPGEYIIFSSFVVIFYELLVCEDNDKWIVFLEKQTNNGIVPNKSRHVTRSENHSNSFRCFFVPVVLRGCSLRNLGSDYYVLVPMDKIVDMISYIWNETVFGSGPSTGWFTDGGYGLIWFPVFEEDVIKMFGS